MADLKQKPLDLFIKRIITFRDERDWKQFHTPKDLAMQISIESAEVLEHFLWKNEEETAAYIKTHKKEIAAELSDVLHNVMILSHDLGIDLEEASAEKMKENIQKYPINKVKGKNKKYSTY
mgnify:CR=1 FL=1